MNQSTAQVRRAALMSQAPYLLDKFLVTGANSLHPKPNTPQPSVGVATERASTFLRNQNCTDVAALIWKPERIVYRSLTGGANHFEDIRQVDRKTQIYTELAKLMTELQSL